MDLSDEEQVLAAANRHVDDARRRIGALTQHLERYPAGGPPAAEGEALLGLLQQGLEAMLAHRDAVEREVKRLRDAERSSRS